MNFITSKLVSIRKQIDRIDKGIIHLIKMRNYWVARAQESGGHRDVIRENEIYRRYQQVPGGIATARAVMYSGAVYAETKNR